MERSNAIHSLLKAQANKDDEFYTLYEDIDKELINYKNQFKDKVVCLPCNDADKNFHQWFKDHKTELGIKRIIAIHYSPDRFTSWYYDDEVKVPLKRNGDVLSTEVITLMKQADIVVTNPPFSIFLDIVKTLERHNLKYILLGTCLKFISRSIYNLFLSHKLYYGFTFGEGGHMKFMSPEGKTREINNIAWFQNVIDKEVPFLELTHTYDPSVYVRYDNYDAIEIKNYKTIPKDYTGLMGVSLAFMSTWNPDQFEIVEMLAPNLKGKHMFKRLIIRQKATSH